MDGLCVCRGGGGARAMREGVVGGSAGFPLNCPTWLSVPGLNKHGHFLLAVHIDTQTRAGAHPHKHSVNG